MKPQIIITGAGVSGSSLAIRLAQNGFRVTLVEREKFPRHKLCGEFISPECLTHFRDLGVFEEMRAAGGDTIFKTVFYAPGGASVTVPSKWFDHGSGGALGLSRAEMDFQLLKRARNLGVEVLEETQVVGLLWEREQVCGVKVRSKSGQHSELTADLTVDATGRAAVLSRFANRQSGQAGKISQRIASSGAQSSKAKLIGFKAHLKNAQIEPGVCEMYFFRGGYGGLIQIENDLSNHCFLIKADVVREFGNNAERVFREVVFQNKRAAETLRHSQTAFDWIAVSIDSFGTKSLAPAPRLLTIGDAAAFIDPFTGSGMLMALESSKIAAQAILLNYAEVKQIALAYEKLHRQKFRTRLRYCSLFRKAAFATNLTSIGVRVLSMSSLARRALAQATRN
ncbi:MAG: NAD(P)/FAD-dependent oxidoreductase [Pyrinomonadaceae bacterium]